MLRHLLAFFDGEPRHCISKLCHNEIRDVTLIFLPYPDQSTLIVSCPSLQFLHHVSAIRFLINRETETDTETDNHGALQFFSGFRAMQEGPKPEWSQIE